MCFGCRSEVQCPLCNWKPCLSLCRFCEKLQCCRGCIAVFTEGRGMDNMTLNHSIQGVGRSWETAVLQLVAACLYVQPSRRTKHTWSVIRLFTRSMPNMGLPCTLVPAAATTAVNPINVAAAYCLQAACICSSKLGSRR